MMGLKQGRIELALWAPSKYANKFIFEPHFVKVHEGLQVASH